MYKKIPAGNTLQPVPANTLPDISHNVNITSTERQADFASQQNQNSSSASAATASTGPAKAGSLPPGIIVPIIIFIGIMVALSVAWWWVKKHDTIE